MVNFIEGQINFGAKNISFASDYEDLNTIAEEGLIEKRETGSGTIYYYVEAMANDMRFGVFITLREKRIDWIRLSWLDSPIKGWDDVSEKGVKDEYRLLLNIVEKMVGGPPDNKKNRQRTWRFTWGQLNVSYDLRAFQADIYMKPR
jgi:hypothetical protein